MRIARLTPAGHLQEIIASGIYDQRAAEMKAERAAREQPNTFFAVLPDEHVQILSIAHRLPPLKASQLHERVA